MADDRLLSLYPDILWAPYFERGKFMYWVQTGRGRTIIGKDGKPRPEFYNDRHVSGGSNWQRLLPPGEEPADQPDADAKEQPKRPGQQSARDDDEI